MGVDRSSLSSSGVASSAARTTGDGLAVVRQQPTSPGNHCDQIDDFGSCNLDSIHQGGPIFEGPTCFVRRQERMIMSPIFSSGEPGPQLTWTAMKTILILFTDGTHRGRKQLSVASCQLSERRRRETG